MAESRRPFGTLASVSSLSLQPPRRRREAHPTHLAGSNIPFMDITEHDIKLSVQVNIVASVQLRRLISAITRLTPLLHSATAFSQQAVACFMNPSPTSESDGPGGTLIMTGATSAWRGSHSFGAFAAGKHGLRALSQAVSSKSAMRWMFPQLTDLDTPTDCTRVRPPRRARRLRCPSNSLQTSLALLTVCSCALALQSSLAGRRWHHHHQTHASPLRRQEGRRVATRRGAATVPSEHRQDVPLPASTDKGLLDIGDGSQVSRLLTRGKGGQR